MAGDAGGCRGQEDQRLVCGIACEAAGRGAGEKAMAAVVTLTWQRLLVAEHWGRLRTWIGIMKTTRTTRKRKRK